MALDAADSRVIYDGSDSTATFAVEDDGGNPIYFEQNGHINVQEYTVATNTFTTLVEGVDYTLTGGPDTGSIVLTAGNLPTGKKLIVWRSQPLSQDEDFGVSDRFASATHDLIADRDRRVDQDLWDEAYRALKLDRAEISYSAESKKIVNVANPTAGTDAVNYQTLQQTVINAGVGDIVGPASSTSGNLPSFADATGNLLQDSGLAAALVQAILDGLAFTSSGIVMDVTGPGSFRIRVTGTGDGLPDNTKVFELFMTESNGTISLSLLNDALNVRHNVFEIARSGKDTEDRDYVLIADRAVAKATLAGGGGTGGGFLTLSRRSIGGVYGAPDQDIVGVSGDPDGTLEYPASSGIIYGRSGVGGVTNSTIPATAITAITNANPAVVTAPGHGVSNGATVYLDGCFGMTQVNNLPFTVANATTDTFELSGIDSSAYGEYTTSTYPGYVYALFATHSIPGNFDGLMGNTPSNARMVEKIKFASYIICSEKSGGTFLDRGLYLGALKDYDQNTILSESNAALVRWSLEDGSMHYASRMNTGLAQEHFWYVGEDLKMTLDDTGFLGLNTSAPVRPFHVSAASQFPARFESTSSTRSEIEFKGTSTTPYNVRVGASGNNFVMNVGNADVMSVNSGASANTLVVSSTGVAVSKLAAAGNRFSASVDFPSITGGLSATVTVTATGFTTGDWIRESGDMGSSVLFVGSCKMTASNTATLRCHNISGGAIDPAAQTFEFFAID